MPGAARKGDPVEHSLAFGGMIAGAVAGAVLGAAIGFATVTTGGAALAIAGGLLGGMSFVSAVGEVIGSAFSCVSGELLSGAATVFINDRPAARSFFDSAGCSSVRAVCFGTHPLAQGSETVYIERAPAGRKGDKGQCTFVVGAGSANVIIGAPPATVVHIGPEVPGWFRFTMFAAGLIGPGMYLRALQIGWAGIGARLGGAFLGGLILGAGADNVMSRWYEPEHWWRKCVTLGASVLGALAGSCLGLRLAVRYPDPGAKSQMLTRMLEKALAEEGLAKSTFKAVGVVVHKNGDVTVSLSGEVPPLTPPVRGTVSRYQKIQNALTKVEESAEVKATFGEGTKMRLAPNLEPPTKGVLIEHQCAETKALLSNPKNPPREMTVWWRGKEGENPYPHPVYGGNYMGPCPTCAENVVTVVAERGIAYKGLWALSVAVGTAPCELPAPQERGGGPLIELPEQDHQDRTERRSPR
ncbi:MAG: PAAR domain-containing protein [Polyangiaceae bacterium]